MRLLILLTIVACLQAWSPGHSQTITLSVKDVPLEKVFKEIRKQSPYSFIYTKEELEGTHLVSLDVKAAGIEQVLEICFREQPLTYAIEENHIIIKKKKEVSIVTQPELSLINIKGRVLNEKDQPVEGVSVRIKGTNKGTSTDANGTFELKDVDENAVLVFSGVNVDPYEMKVNGKTEWTINLKTRITEDDAILLKVNTGYQELPKERATGSFDFINNQMLNQQVSSDILNRLDGVASGVLFPKQQLQNGPNFMIRGLSTINGPKNPLVVLDNFPYDGDLNNINPNDIESITILKDAAASSIWGTRAGNGVVVITSKKGNFNKPLKIELNTNRGFTEKPDLLSLKSISPADYISIESMLFDKGYYNSYLSNTSTRPAVSPVVEILAKRRANLISASDSASQINTYRNTDIRDQYRTHLYRKPAMQRFALNLNGGSENIAYYVSAGYDKIFDQIENINERYTFRSENLYKPVKNLQVSLNIQYTLANSHSGRPAYGSFGVGQWQIPYLPFEDGYGGPLPVALIYRQTYIDTAGAGRLLNWNYYPTEDWKHNSTKIRQQDIFAGIGLDYRLLKGLNVSIKYLYERQNSESRNLQDLESFVVRDKINRFSQLNRATGVVKYIVPIGSILNLFNSILESKNLRGQLNYTYANNKHAIIAIAGSEIRQTHNFGNGNIYYGYNDNTLVTTNVDLINTYPTFINGSFNNIGGGASFSDKLNRYVSVFGNAAYSYNDKYSVSISARRDASNLFGVSTNNKWNPLWSAGTGWEISKETFYRLAFLKYLKLRATLGFSGNTDPSKTGVVTLIYASPQPPNNLPTTRIDQFPNPELRSEKVRTINIGLDFQSKDNIVTGSFEAYFKKGIDLFGAAPFDPTAGLNGQPSLVRNIANMKGRGIDITLSSKNLDNRLKWYTTFLISYNESKTTNYYIDSNLRSGSFISSGIVNFPIPDRPLYSVIALPWAGLDANGNPQGYVNKNVSLDYNTIINKTRLEDLIYKPAIPIFFGSLVNTFTFKGISLSINIDFRAGYYFMKPTINYSTLFSNGSVIGTSDFINRWQKPGDEKITNVPAMIYPANGNRDIFYNYSEINIDKADNIKLRYLNISYDFFNKNLSKKSSFQQLQLYVNGSNLGILWRANKNGLDPDFISSVPAAGKSYAIGIRAGF